MSVEGFHAFDNPVQLISTRRAVNLLNVVDTDSVQFQNIIIDPHQSIVDRRFMNERGVAEH